MTKKNRLEYLICTLIITLIWIPIYNSISNQLPLTDGSTLQSYHSIIGYLIGFIFSACLTAIILSVGFFKKRGLVFKTVAAILWPITLVICIYAGILFYIPYQIFNIIKLILPIKDDKKPSDSEIFVEDQDFPT